MISLNISLHYSFFFLSFEQEMQSMNMLNQKQDLPDLSEMAANFFGGGGGSSSAKKKEKAVKIRKK